jgi:hypothetical protein
VLIAGALWLHALSKTFGSRVVLYAKTPNGTEMCIYQTFTWTTEPYQTAFYSRKFGNAWEWFYYDHQDLPWMSGRIVLDATNHIANVFRGKRLVARYDWTKDQFIHLLKGTTNGPTETPNMWIAPPERLPKIHQKYISNAINRAFHIGRLFCLSDACCFG